MEVFVSVIYGPFALNPISYLHLGNVARSRLVLSEMLNEHE